MKHLETSSEVADLLLRNIINLNRHIVVNEDIRNNLVYSKTSGNIEQENIRSRMISELLRVISNSSMDTRYVDSMCLFDVHFQAYCLNRPDNAGIYEGTDKAYEIKQTEWYQKAVQAQGKVEFFGYNVIENDTNTFSTVKLFRNFQSEHGDSIGLLIVNLSKPMFENYCQSPRRHSR
ncbi:hypothetical protein ACE3NQ_04435 [Paenibacillus terreus]|uniref:Uncharacterized protein n=1 Tax=Paenibacillus terreus TaxID=1387834 RepID=A0ABV5B3B6_9BACL